MNRVDWFDEAALERVHKLGGEHLVRRLVALFLANAPDRLAEARSGERAGDFKATEQAVHSLKSSAGNVGALRLQELAGAVEEQAEQKRGEGMAAQLNELEKAFAQVKIRLEEEAS